MSKSGEAGYDASEVEKESAIGKSARIRILKNKIIVCCACTMGWWCGVGANTNSDVGE